MQHSGDRQRRRPQAVGTFFRHDDHVPLEGGEPLQFGRRGPQLGVLEDRIPGGVLRVDPDALAQVELPAEPDGGRELFLDGGGETIADRCIRDPLGQGQGLFHPRQLGAVVANHPVHRYEGGIGGKQVVGQAQLHDVAFYSLLQPQSRVVPEGGDEPAGPEIAERGVGPVGGNLRDVDFIAVLPVCPRRDRVPCRSPCHFP